MVTELSQSWKMSLSAHWSSSVFGFNIDSSPFCLLFWNQPKSFICKWKLQPNILCSLTFFHVFMPRYNPLPAVFSLFKSCFWETMFSINTRKLYWATDRRVSFLVRVKKCHCMLSSFIISCLSSLSHPCTHSQTHFLWSCQASSVVFFCHCVCSLCACWALTSPASSCCRTSRVQRLRSNIDTAVWTSVELLWMQCSRSLTWSSAEEAAGGETCS